MRQSSDGGGRSAGSGSPSSPNESAAGRSTKTANQTETATEIVTRPDPGIARGRWEAPAWAFWVALVVILVAAGLYAFVRVKRGSKQ